MSLWPMLPMLWILLMLGLVTATVVVGVKENKARAKATKQIMGGQAGIPMSDADGGGQGMPRDPLAGDGFGQGDVEFAEFDDKNFK